MEGIKEDDEMSRKTQVIRRYVRPIYDPEPRVLYDPDPDPPIAILIFVALLVLGGVTVFNPNIWNNILVMINPEISKLEKERQETLQKAINAIMIGLGVIGVIGIIYFLWRWKTHEKAVKNMRRRSQY